MRTSGHVAMLLLAIPACLLPASLSWSEPTKLGEIQTLYNPIDAPRLAAGPNGQIAVAWGDGNTSIDEWTGIELFIRLLTANSGWGAATIISDSNGLLQPPIAIGMGGDGSVIAAWRVVDLLSFQSQLLVRKFVPGEGWGLPQVLSTGGGNPVLAIAPDGRAHIVFYENSSWVVKTLAPGEEAWSATVILRDESPYYQGTAQLVAGDGFAYATFPEQDSLLLAMFNSHGWQPATKLESGNPSQLLINNGHVVLSWTEPSNGSDVVQRVQRLTQPSDAFAVPRVGGTLATCNIALSADGTVFAFCPIRGDSVPNCFDECNRYGYGCNQAYYAYIEAFRHHVVGDWQGADVISDKQQRAWKLGYGGFGRIKGLGNAQGDVLALWASDVPCQSNGIEVSMRLLRSNSGLWDPVAGPALGTKNSAMADVAADARGTFHGLWTEGTVGPKRVLVTAELAAHLTQTADINADGVVNCTDLGMVRASLGKKAGEPGFDDRADTNQDGIVDVKDLAFVAQQLPAEIQCP